MLTPTTFQFLSKRVRRIRAKGLAWMVRREMFLYYYVIGYLGSLWFLVVFFVVCRLVSFYFCGLLMVGLLLFLEVVDVFFVVIIVDC